jgi:protein TonB
MFADTLLESAPNLAHRSAWTKLLSVLLQCMALAVALTIPLLYPERLQYVPPPPTIQLTSASQPVTRTVEQNTSMRSAPTETTEIVQPRYVPTIRPGTDKPRDSGPSGPPAAPCIGTCGGPAIAGLFPPTALTPPHAKPPVPAAPVRVSDWQLGGLVHKVLPEYPIIAKQTRIQGAVVLAATIGKDGRVEHLQLISGHPFLAKAAINAVEQWQYRPYILNHEPIEVQTQITVNFTLGRD